MPRPRKNHRAPISPRPSRSLILNVGVAAALAIASTVLGRPCIAIAAQHPDCPKPISATLGPTHGNAVSLPFRPTSWAQCQSSDSSHLVGAYGYLAAADTGFAARGRAWSLARAPTTLLCRVLLAMSDLPHQTVIMHAPLPLLLHLSSRCSCKHSLCLIDRRQQQRRVTPRVSQTYNMSILRTRARLDQPFDTR
ncbi:hypothetical protein T440DRAFT_270279 [Plenodomus tracheiphilus IPT5]|uniref:Uncharacterized protein n=1 Tax=Plenodomus tracheiphilus IPT5 TaxID=1408161 RepID=A0A6A7BJB1_9PLEO|nr:hypothetical protein T440DRAFT_270279 [Plenodomus tracheiphilus IPT5]